MNYNRLLNLEGKTILVIGDIMLDNYLFGDCFRISPEAPVPVVNLIKEDKMLGGAGNVLKNLVAFGATCEIISVVGDDLSGDTLVQLVNNLNISNYLLIKDSNRRTTEKVRIVSSGQQLIRLDKESLNPIDEFIETKILNYIKENINNYDVIVFSDYLKGLLTYGLCSKIIDMANIYNKITIVDPKGSDFLKYRNINLIKPNLKEAEILIGAKINSKKEIKSACEKLKDLLGCEYVVITLSENGIAYFDNEFSIIPTHVSSVFDVSGAGDTVLASLAICLKQGYSLKESCMFSNMAASLVIQKFGSTSTSINEVLGI